MKTYKTLMITCMGLLASASSLAASGMGYNQRDYEPSNGYYSEPYYNGGHVSEDNDDYRSMGPYYNNNNHYDYNQNSGQMNGPRQNQMQSDRHLSMNDSMYNSNGYNSGMNSSRMGRDDSMMNGNQGYNNNSMPGSMYNNSNSGSMNNNNGSGYNQGARPYQGQMMNGSGYISLNDESSTVGDRIRNAIQRDTSLSSNARAVLVTADGNGQVTLSGSVATAAEKSKVESLAKSIEGVKSVKNNINVQNHR